jgi:hypothetical protein
MADDNLVLVVGAGALVLIWMFIRSRRGTKTPSHSRRHWEEYMRAQEEAGGAPEPEWHLKELDAGGMFHLSLPRGLEEDYKVTRKDRIERSDEQIEYALEVDSGDPEHPMWLNWQKLGIHTHAWLVEGTGRSMGELGLSSADMDSMRETGEGTLTYRDRKYELVAAETLATYLGGRRPSKDFRRWDFRDETKTRQVVIYHKDWENESYQVFSGHELWLRDMTIVAPRGDQPASGVATTPDVAPSADAEDDEHEPG